MNENQNTEIHRQRRRRRRNEGHGGVSPLPPFFDPPRYCALYESHPDDVGYLGYSVSKEFVVSSTHKLGQPLNSVHLTQQRLPSLHARGENFL